MQAWYPEERNQVFKIPAYNPYKQHNQGPDGAARAQQKSKLELDGAGHKLQAFFPKYAAKAAAAEASLSLLLDRISKRAYDPALELREFADLPPWVQGSDVWKVSWIRYSCSCCWSALYYTVCLK